MVEPFHSEEEMKEAFPDSYRPPTIDALIEDTDNWDAWINSVEIKLSNQGKMILGLGAGLLVTLMLTVMQGKVVITLVKAQREIVNAINNIIGSGPIGAHSGSSGAVSYAEPQGKVDESKAEPIDQDEFDELKLRMDASTNDVIDPEGLV